MPTIPGSTDTDVTGAEFDAVAVYKMSDAEVRHLAHAMSFGALYGRAAPIVYNSASNAVIEMDYAAIEARALMALAGQASRAVINGRPGTLTSGVHDEVRFCADGVTP